MTRSLRTALAALAFLTVPLLAAPPFVVGDVVRLSKSEMLVFMGKDLQGAPKGQEFSVLKHDAIKRLVFVEYYNKDNALIAATLPDGALEKVGHDNRNAPTHAALVRCRQAIGLRKLFEAKKYIAEGLALDPKQPELKAIEASVDKDIEEADGKHKDANSMRRFQKGTIHALTAIEMGLKLCADHPKLRALKKEMEGAFTERTSPPVNATFLAAAKTSTPKTELEEGHRIYTTRCTECHDLELLDSRSLSAWRTIVGGMSRRAKVDDAQQERILAYITAAQSYVENAKPE